MLIYYYLLNLKINQKKAIFVCFGNYEYKPINYSNKQLYKKKNHN